jgi:hypothetical protein
VFPDLNQKVFETTLRAIELAFAARSTHMELNSPAAYESTTIEAVAKSVLPADDSSLKWASFGSGITNNPKQELDRLFQRMVQRYEQTTLSVGTIENWLAASKRVESAMDISSISTDGSWVITKGQINALANISTAGQMVSGDYASLVQGVLGTSVYPSSLQAVSSHEWASSSAALGNELDVLGLATKMITLGTDRKTSKT